MSKTIKTRIINKHDTAANWSNATFISQKGEFYVYDDYDQPKLKIGDGVHTVAELSFINDAEAAQLLAHINDTTVHITAAERTKWNAASTHANASHAPADAEKNVQSDWNETSTSSDAYIKNKPALKTVATSGSYNDLTNKPTIPTKSSWNYDDAYVKYSASQSLTDTQKSTARANIGAGTSSFSGSYNDLTNKPTIPTVNNATLTIQKNGTDVATFTANSSSNATANITVPTGAAADKGVDTSISAASTSANLPTSAAVAAFVEGKGYKTTDNNTTYTVSTGANNGQIKVTPSSGSAYNVDVKGLGSAAYKATSDFAAASHGTHVTADTVKSALGTGTGTSKYLREDGTWVTPPNTTYESKTAASGGTAVSLVTTGEKYTWNNKANTTAATQSAAGLMSADDKKKLDGIASGATANNGTVTSVRVQAGTGLASSTSTAQTSTLNTTISIASGYKLPTTTEWSAKANTGDLAAVATSGDYADLQGAPGIASSAADGLMSKTDKGNLDTLVNLLKNDDADTTIDTIQEVLDAFANTPEGTNIANALAGKSKVGHTHDVTTKNAAPHTHTHSVTVNGTTGANSGTAVNAVTGYGSFSGGSGSLTADTTSTNGIKYVESVTHGAASLTGTTSFNTDAIKDVTLSASTSSSDGPAYVESVTHTSASLTGTTTFVSKQGTFSAGTTPVSSASPTNTTVDTSPAYIVNGSSNPSGLVIGSFADGVLTISAGTATPLDHIHTYSKTTDISLTRGTAPSLGEATTASVGISGGSITPVTKYLKKATTAASKSSVGISSAAASVTTKYLHHSHTGASLGTASTAAVAPNGHTHSYGSSTALTTGNNSGTAVAAVTSVSASEE